jgi:AraC family transcriptional regulator
MNAAIDYIEESLEDEIDYNKAAKIACCSLYHFQRIFSFVAGMGLSDYVRQRRMTKAAFDLLNGSERIIDIAQKYGYNSPTAFTRAFINMHGIAPSMVRVQGVPLSSFPRITFHLSVDSVK